MDKDKIEAIQKRHAVDECRDMSLLLDLDDGRQAHTDRGVLLVAVKSENAGRGRALLYAKRALDQRDGVRAELKRSREIVKRFIVAMGHHLEPSWRESLIEGCGLVEDSIGFVSLPKESSGCLATCGINGEHALNCRSQGGGT